MAGALLSFCGFYRWKLILGMVRMIASKYRLHLELLAVIKKETDFKLITAMVPPLKIEAIPAYMLAADRLEDYWLLFITIAGLVGEDIDLHFLGSFYLEIEAGNRARPTL